MRHDKAEQRNSAPMAEVTKLITGKGTAGSRETLAAVPDREPQAPGPADHEPALRTLSPAECFGLLELGGIGRIGFAAADGIMMLPVNFAVTGKTIIFRTAPDTLLAIYANGPVGFEVDHLDQAHREGWSVLVRGRAHKVTDVRAYRANSNQRAMHRATLSQPRGAGYRSPGPSGRPGCHRLHPSTAHAE